MYKYAGALGDTIRGITGHVASELAGIPGIPVISVVSGAHGILNKSDIEDVKKGDNTPLLAYIPGVMEYRVGRRLALVERKLRKNKKAKKKSLSEFYGPLTSMLLSAALGAGTGAYLKGDKKSIINGALIGAGSGLAANITGSLIGASTRPRTMEEQKDYYDNTSVLPSYLIPGVGSYNRNKAIQISNILKDES